MVKRLLFTTFIIVSTICSLSSCIKSEAPNAEADIETCTFPEGVPLLSDPTIENETITVVIDGQKLTDRKFSPIFTITEGATMSPASGTERDFAEPQKYVVTSQSGAHSKTYTVSILNADIPTYYDFELWKETSNKDKSKTYEIPYELIGDGEIKASFPLWSCGNGGFGMAISSGATKEDYPTSSSTDAQSGNFAAKLVTMLVPHKTMPMAGGNLFIGSFNIFTAMQDALASTKFGTPFNKRPKVFKGFYKYTPGPIYKKLNDSGESLVEVPGMVDQCSIYSVIYEKGSGEMLDGRNVLNDPRLIAVAKVNTSAPTIYTSFEVEYDYASYAIEFDEQKSAEYKYYMAVVFSASDRAAYFEGAEGSTLFVDSVEVECGPADPAE